MDIDNRLIETLVMRESEDESLAERGRGESNEEQEVGKEAIDLAVFLHFPAGARAVSDGG